MQLAAMDPPSKHVIENNLEAHSPMGIDGDNTNNLMTIVSSDELEQGNVELITNTTEAQIKEKEIDPENAKIIEYGNNSEETGNISPGDNYQASFIF